MGARRRRSCRLYRDSRTCPCIPHWSMACLNEDLILLVIEVLCAIEGWKDLRAFSQTSRWIRALCMPATVAHFQDTGRMNTIRLPGDLDSYVPEWVRPHVRYDMTFV